MTHREECISIILQILAEDPPESSEQEQFETILRAKSDEEIAQICDDIALALLSAHTPFRRVLPHSNVDRLPFVFTSEGKYEETTR